MAIISKRWRQFGLTAGDIYEVFLTYDYWLLNFQVIKKEVGVQFRIDWLLYIYFRYKNTFKLEK